MILQVLGARYASHVKGTAVSLLPPMEKKDPHTHFRIVVGRKHLAAEKMTCTWC